jgi:hypothetical protein
MLVQSSRFNVQGNRIFYELHSPISNFAPRKLNFESDDLRWNALSGCNTLNDLNPESHKEVISFPRVARRSRDFVCRDWFLELALEP